MKAPKMKQSKSVPEASGLRNVVSMVLDIATNFKRMKVSFVEVLILVIIFSSCKKDNDDTDVVLDVSGFWVGLNEINGDCSGATDTEYDTYYYSVKQAGENVEITVFPNEDVIHGKIEGNVISWSGTLPTTSGKSDINFSGTVNPETNTIVGDGEWKWYSENYTCSGTSAITGSKVNAENIDFSGKWNGSWKSKEYAMEGTFAANITQNGNILSGTISVSEININDAVLSGKVDGNIVYFGDVDGVIKFVGIYDNKEAVGKYSYNSLSDEGNWVASPDSAISVKKLTLIDSYDIETGCADMAYDNKHFYLLSNLDITCIDKTGSTVFSYPAPGSYPSGIAFDGEHLLVGDNSWGTSKIYKMFPSVVNVLNLPADGEVIGTMTDGNKFWFGSGNFSDITIYKTASNGAVEQSFTLQGRHFHGIEKKGENIWISFEDTEMFSNTALAKFSMDGNLLDTFHLEDGQYGRLASDGEYIWMMAGNLLYAFDEDGNLVKTLTTQVSADYEEIGGFTFDGSNFWCATKGYEKSGKVYCLNKASGAIISSFDCPGQNTIGLTYDGRYLRLADDVAKKLFTLPTDGDYYLPFPPFDLSALCAKNNKLYAYSGTDENIVVLDYTAEVIDNFSITLDWTGNFYFDGENYWSAENLLGNLKRIIKFNSQGELLESYQPESATQSVVSLIVEGNSIWCISGDMMEDKHQLIKYEFED